jgi:hypothetical protein
MCGNDVDQGVQQCGNGKVLALVRVTPHFAPGAPGQRCTIEYDIDNMRGDVVTLDVRNRQGHLVYQRELTSFEKAKPVWGLKSLDWDGQLADGTLANPLGSPYAITLLNHGEAYRTVVRPTRVLVHSIQVQLGPWDTQQRWAAGAAPPGGADYARWVRDRLGVLGYFGGPVDADFAGYQAKATTRYCAVHRELHQAVHVDYVAPAGPAKTAFDAALRAGTNPRSWLTRPQGQGRAQLQPGDLLDRGADVLRVHVEALPFMGTRGAMGAPIGVNEMEHQYPNPDEPGATTRVQHDQARLNRPLVPLEAVIRLRGSDDQPKLAPRAVGAVTLVWSHTEPQEDLALQFADRPDVCSYPRRYVERALRLDGARTGPTDNNCPARFGGIRGADSPLLPGNHYAPYAGVQAGATVRTVAYAREDQAHYRRCQGRAGIFVRPSIIAGDAYRVRAELDVAGLDPTQGPVHGETSDIQVWRTTKVAAVVGWPARDLAGVWNAVRREYAAAYVDLDTSAVATCPITDFLDHQRYVAWLRAGMAHQYDLVFPDVFHPRVSAEAMFTTDDPDPNLYFTMVTGENVLDMLARHLGPRLRARLPHGLVCITHRVALPEKNPPPVSIGVENGMCLLDHATPGQPYYIVAHELAHCLWLNHGRHTIRNPGQHPQAEMVTEHDPSDHSCVMDYTKDDDAAHPHRHVDRYAPHFCGKCNLKLRGWHVLAVGAGTELPMDAPRIVAAEWGQA